MVGVNVLRNNATNMIFENLPLFTSLTITKKCELVCFISIDFEASRGIFSLRTADVFPVVASETWAKKTGCSRRLGHFNCSFFIIPKGPIVYYVPEGGGVGADWVLRIVWCIKTLPTHPPPPLLKYMTITYENCIRSISLHLVSKRIKEILTQKYILFLGHISYFYSLHILCIPKLTPQNQAS